MTKEKKKQRRADVVKYVEPKDDRLGFVKRFGHMPDFQKPIGWDGKEFRETFKTKTLPFLTTEEFDWDESVKKNENRLIWGDNLSVMRSLPSDSIDLIYIDPPFFSGRNYNCIFGDDDEIRTFNDIWDGGLPTYLAWLNARIWEMKRLLKDTGSICIHLDWHAAHYVKCELDKIFGYDNFINEIIWRYRTGGSSKRTFSRKHDSLLFYGKTNKYKFNLQKEKAYTKSKSRKAGVINYGGGMAEFFEDANGVYNLVNMTDVWDISYINSQSSERIGYPTQKPEELLERIILSATNKGDTVADFFSGGGTTVATAEKLGRRWIGCDVSRIAVSVARDRIQSIYNKEAGLKPLEKKPTCGFQLQNHGAYDKGVVRQLDETSYTNFILQCFVAEYDISFSDLHDAISNGDTNSKAKKALQAWQNLLKDFGPESSKENEWEAKKKIAEEAWKQWGCDVHDDKEEFVDQMLCHISKAYNQGRQSALPSSDIWKPLFSGNTAKYSKKIKERVAYADGAVAMYRYIKSHIEQKEQE